MVGVSAKRLSDRLEALSLDGRRILGIYLDPVAALRLERDRESGGPAADFGGDFPTFGDYPVRESPRPGVWIVVDAGDGLTDTVEVLA